MPGPQFIVCESSGRWAIALRWLMDEPQMRLVETRPWEDCRRALAARPTSFLALELTAADLEAVVLRLLDVHQHFPRARAVVLCDRRLAAAEPLLREAGAVHVAYSTRDLAAVIQLAKRHLAAADEPAGDVRQAVWQRLPWEAVS